MTNINTICKFGHAIDKEVLSGVILNNCNLKVFSSESYDREHFDRRNIFFNWKHALKNNTDNYFIGMDSDIVLKDTSVAELFLNIKDNDMICFPVKDRKISHGIWIVKKEIIEKVPFEFKEGTCPLCNWITAINNKGYKAVRIESHEVGEIITAGEKHSSETKERLDGKNHLHN